MNSTGSPGTRLSAAANDWSSAADVSLPTTPMKSPTSG
jgi:hypothetical protein